MIKKRLMGLGLGLCLVLVSCEQAGTSRADEEREVRRRMAAVSSKKVELAERAKDQGLGQKDMAEIFDSANQAAAAMEQLGGEEAKVARAMQKQNAFDQELSKTLDEAVLLRCMDGASLLEDRDFAERKRALGEYRQANRRIFELVQADYLTSNLNRFLDEEDASGSERAEFFGEVQRMWGLRKPHLMKIRRCDDQFCALLEELMELTESELQAGRLAWNGEEALFEFSSPPAAERYEAWLEEVQQVARQQSEAQVKLLSVK